MVKGLLKSTRGMLLVDVLVAVAMVMLLLFLALEMTLLWQREQRRAEERTAWQFVVEQLKGDERTVIIVRQQPYRVVKTERQICVTWKRGTVCSDR